MIKRIIINTSQMGGAVAARAVTALILNKLVALFYGPTGITLLAHLQNLLTLVVQLPNDGTNQGAVNLLQSKSDEQRSIIIRRVFQLNLILTIGALFIIFLGKQFFWEKFSEVTNIFTLQIAFFISLFFIVGHYTIISIFRADRDYQRFAIISSLASLILLITGAVISSYFSVSYFLIGYVIAQGMAILISLMAYRKFYKYGLTINFKFRITSVSRPLIEFLIMAGSVWLFSYLVDFLVRNYAITSFGFESTGHWQAVVKFSDQLKSVFIATVGAVFFTEISSRLAKKINIMPYLRRNLGLFIPGILGVLGIIYFLREPVLLILYSEDFLEAERFFLFQLLGDALAAISFFFAYIVMALRKTIAYISLQAMSGIIYLFLIYLLIPHFGLQGIVISHFIRYVVFLIISYFVAVKLLKN